MTTSDPKHEPKTPKADEASIRTPGVQGLQGADPRRGEESRGWSKLD